MSDPDNDQVQDVADLNDPTADDPTDPEVTDPEHADYVSPWLPDDAAVI